MLRVLRERCPYYAYTEIEALRRSVIQRTRRYGRHPRIISFKNAKLLFRVVNYANPKVILQFGTSYGVSTASMLSVSSRSKIVLFEPHLSDYEVTASVLGPFMNRIMSFPSINESIKGYKKLIDSDDIPFILINSVDERDAEALRSYITSIISSQGIIVMRNLSRSESMANLWAHCRSRARYGMAFSNEKIAVIVSNPKLPRQEYSLWF